MGMQTGCVSINVQNRCVFSLMGVSVCGLAVGLCALRPVLSMCFNPVKNVCFGDH